MRTIYRIEWKKSAVKELSKLDKQAATRILAAVEELSQKPLPQGVRKLVGSDNAYRIRIGDYRVVYSLFQKQLLVHIVRVVHRREVY